MSRMTKEQEKRLQELAASSIVGGDITAVLAEVRELRELERSYCHQLGELARLCNVVGRWFFGKDDVKADPETVSALDEIMEYVEAIAPPTCEPGPQWFVHIIGPDDLHPCRGEFDALRRANQHNRSWARLMADEPAPNDPYCVAVAVTKEMLFPGKPSTRRGTLCSTCDKAGVSCPVYPQGTNPGEGRSVTGCVEYSEAVRR